MESLHNSDSLTLSLVGIYIYILKVEILGGISGLLVMCQHFSSFSKHLDKRQSNFIENVYPRNSVLSAIPKLKSKNQQLNKNAVN